MSRINVLVTGVSGGGVGEQILKALKLSTLDLRIIATDINEHSVGLRESDQGYIVPLATEKSYIDNILNICDKEKVDVIFPGSEAELKFFSENRHIFIGKGILLPINPKKVINLCTDKSKTMQFLSKHGYSFPKSITIKAKEDIEKVNFIPAVIKPSIGSGGSKDILIAQSKYEVEIFCNYLLKIYREFIVQEYVGTPDSEFTVGVLNDLNGKFINSIAIQKSITTALNNRIKIKNTTGMKSLGEHLIISSGISEGYVGKFHEITSVCERVSKELGACSAINIQCRSYMGNVYIYEINPRYSGTTSIRAMMGYNEPDIMIRKYILNENIERNFSYKFGYVARGLREILIDGGIT